MKPALAVMLVLLCSGCAVLDKDHRHVGRYLDEHAAPKSPTVAALLTPIAIPVGFTALLVDGVLVNPVLAAPSAWRDARHAAFEHVAWQGVHEIGLMPMRCLTFAAVLIGSELAHCAIPL